MFEECVTLLMSGRMHVRERCELFMIADEDELLLHDGHDMSAARHGRHGIVRPIVLS